MLQYFGFQEEPFGVTPDPRCLYLSRTHQHALSALQHGFSSNRGFTAMIAPPGMGKTTLLFRFLEDTRETARTVFLFDIDAQCEPREFIAYILRDMGITPGQGSSEMHEQLSEALVKENRAGRKFVVVIDEAQNLSDAVLERVRLLTNFETSQGKLMHILLSGQPQLSDKLMQPSLVQLRQRISTVCHIDPLSAEETAGYIDYRVKLAGYVGKPLFTNDALALIAEAGQGVPREINNLCYNALSACYRLMSKQVDGSMMSKAIAGLELTRQPGEPAAASAVDVAPEQPRERKLFTSLNLNPQPEEPVAAASDSAAEEPIEPEEPKLAKRLTKLWIPAAAVLLVACAVGALQLIESRAPRPRRTANDHSLNGPALPASAPAPAAPAAGAAPATEPTPSTAPFEITVQPNQSLQDISVKYLGGWDLQRMHEILALNPKLTDPDHIEVGQKIWLPGPSQVPKPAAAAGQPAGPAHEPLQAKAPNPKPSTPAAKPATPAHEPLQAKAPNPKPSTPAAKPAAPAHEPLQAKAPNPKPSTPAAKPATPAHEPLQAKTPNPKPSTPAAKPAIPAHEPLQAKTPNPKPSTPAATTPQASAAAPAPSSGAGTNPAIAQQSPAPSTGAGTNPATPQQSPATAGQGGSPAGSSTGGAATQVRPALAGNAQEGAQTAATSNVRPALPAAIPLMVQIAAVAHTEDAEVLVSTLRKRGYFVTTLRDPADNLIRVRIGPFYSREEADRWRVKLLDDGYNAIILP
jgi:general secretion pathway protein A